MRLFLKIIGAIVATIVLILLTFLAWAYFYTGGLPDVTVLQVFVPVDKTQTNIPKCGTPASATAIPAYEMARFRDALIAAEGDPKDMVAFRDGTAGMLFPRTAARRKATYSSQLARQVYCLHTDGIMGWHLSVWRTTVQIERRFKPDDILTIYANSAFFGNETYGIENASQKYFKKKALQLSIVEDAFLAGLIRSPGRFLKNTDGALERRNAVLDRMAALQMISAAEAEKAKAQPSGLGTN